MSREPETRKIIIGPDYACDSLDQAHLHALTTMEGYRVFDNIMLSVCMKFQENALHAEDDVTALANLRLAKAAKMFYDTVVTRVAGEVTQYTHAIRESDPIIDPTEEALDIGDFAELLEDVPNFLGDVILEEESK